MNALIINCSPVRTGATAEIVKIIKPVYNFKANSTTVKKTNRQIEKENKYNYSVDE